MNKPLLDSHGSAVNPPLSEQISDSIQGKDEPMEESHPEGPPLLAFASYPIVLIVGIVVALTVFWLTSSP